MEETLDRFRHVCWLHTEWTINRYLMSCAEGRWNGAEKAQRHRELCQFYVAAIRGIDDPERVDLCESDYTSVHSTTQELTDNMDEVIGFPITGCPDYDALAPKFFDRFHALALQALDAQ